MCVCVFARARVCEAKLRGVSIQELIDFSQYTIPVLNGLIVMPISHGG